MQLRRTSVSTQMHTQRYEDERTHEYAEPLDAHYPQHIYSFTLGEIGPASSCRVWPPHAHLQCDSPPPDLIDSVQKNMFPRENQMEEPM